MAKKFAKAPEGYVKKSLGFPDKCSVCKTAAKMLTFSRKLRDIQSDGYDLSEYTFGSNWVCSFECFKRTDEYVGPNPPLDQDVAVGHALVPGGIAPNGNAYDYICKHPKCLELKGKPFVRIVHDRAEVPA